MENSNLSGDSQSGHQAPPDETLVEGPGSPLKPGLQAGTRINVTQVGETNPYGGELHPPERLPAGNESIQIGSGTVVSVLGTGGMARVYKIWNEKLEIFRAVKVIIPGSGNELRNRFETEAKITAKLHHPNIVEIYGVGEYNTLPYIEMELIDGESLEAMIARQGKLPDPVAAAIAIFIVEALVYAHGQEFLLYGKNYKGIIHRDLKPANIMIAKDGRVKLMDFGIARPTEASLHTVDGNIVGTMQYLSPEQLDGIDIDNRTDIYSLGAILYEMLTGAKTFPQDTITNLMRKKISNEYRKFSDFDFSVSTGLARVAQKCLQLSKDQRYPDAGHLLDDLNTVFRSLGGKAPLATIKSFLCNPAAAAPVARTAKHVWMNKVALALAGVAAAVVATVVIISFVLTGPRTPKLQADHESVPPAVAVVAPAIPVTPAVVTVPEPGASGAANRDLQPLDPASAGSPPKLSSSPAVPRQAAPAAPTANYHAAPKPASVVPKAQPQDARSALTAKYQSTDPLQIGRAALSAHAYADVITALENAAIAGSGNTLRVVFLLEACIESGKTQEAEALIAGSPVGDAQFDVLAGRLYMAEGKNKRALDLYQSAITKPSVVRDITQIRKDALYYTALVRAEHYHSSPTSETKAAALSAWNAVTRIYADETTSPRCRQAAGEIAGLQ